MSHVVYVVPCYNEAERLDFAGFSRLLDLAPISLLFVDDGLTDATRTLVERFAHDDDRVRVHPMGRNRGKGEAVRQGLATAMSSGATFVGYADADLATPPSELARLARLALDDDADLVMGSRVARAGAAIDRKAGRHYLGRVFATYASLVLDARIYDTQCGAKVLRNGPRLERALREPFVSRWVFDVELLGRLLHDPIDPMPFDRLVEVPLDRWSDVSGSHIRVASIPGIAADIARATLALRRWRR